LLQMGERPGMPLYPPMPTVSTGVAELRIHGQDRQFRAFCFVESSQGILVMHAFVKKTRETPPSEIRLARKRLKEMLDD